MLTTDRLEWMLARIPALNVAVLGDLFLDRYLDIDGGLVEASVETGQRAYQVVKIRSYPGAAGTVINNLAALGVSRIDAISVIGDDGEGYELCQALRALGVVVSTGVFAWEGRRTPTYTKPMLHESGQPPRELNRLDIKNHSGLPAAAEDRLLQALDDAWPRVHALLVLDQLDRRKFGVVTDRVVDRLAELGSANPGKLILADSRERIDEFRAVSLKPNATECVRAVMRPSPTQGVPHVEDSAMELARRTGRAVFCTCGEQGILVAESGRERPVRVPACPVAGPIDIVGAGDSTSAGIACALAAGASLEEAAAFGNLVASITIQQIGTTGTASPTQLRQRWRDLHQSM
jgi:rfaE bifunctional protein kinase chain/domain